MPDFSHFEFSDPLLLLFRADLSLPLPRFALEFSVKLLRLRHAQPANVLGHGRGHSWEGHRSDFNCFRVLSDTRPRALQWGGLSCALTAEPTLDALLAPAAF